MRWQKDAEERWKGGKKPLWRERRREMVVAGKEAACSIFISCFSTFPGRTGIGPCTHLAMPGARQLFQNPIWIATEGSIWIAWITNTSTEWTNFSEVKQQSSAGKCPLIFFLNGVHPSLRLQFEQALIWQIDTHGGKLFHEMTRLKTDIPDYYFTARYHTNFYNPYFSGV